MKILVVRRDNIGDLVLTTPVFRGLRARFPQARIEAFVNSYNAPVLAGHPDIDRVHTYTKAKHRFADAGGGWIARLRQLIALRREHFDHVILAAPGVHVRQIRLARFLAPAHITAFVPSGRKLYGVDQPVEHFPDSGRHHVEEAFRILSPFGITGEPPAPRIAVSRAARVAGAPPRVAVHVSARKPSSRWPEDRYAQLMRVLHERFAASFRLFWSPGAESDPRHPGDDGKANRILDSGRGVPVEAVETRDLGRLIEGLAGCDALVCSDGGAMHVAAALGMPVVCFFGDSPAARWHPWGVPYRLLQPASRDVRDVSVEEAANAFAALLTEPRASTPEPT